MAKKLDPYRETARMALEPWLVEAALACLPQTLSLSADHRGGHSYPPQGQVAGVVERTPLVQSELSLALLWQI